MPPPSTGEFIDLLQRSNLLAPEQWAEAQRTIVAPFLAQSSRRGAAEPLTAAALADRLVRASWLTRWQADNLLAGVRTFFFGRYKLLECIGVGGMGAVYKARHDRMGRIVALKVMSQAIVHSRRAIARFRNEIQAVAALNHPHIVAAYDADCVGKVHFLVMEYVPGHDLGWYLSEQGPLPIEWSCDCIRQAALGLAHAHEQGLVHRDIKPTNLLVTDDPDTDRPLVKVLDLGLARVAGAAALDDETDAEPSRPLPAGLTQAGQVLGTPDYMSPEQAADTRQADARSDIYSLGCTLFRMLTGEMPFPGETVPEKIAARQHGVPRRLRALRPEAPAALELVIDRMMARDPQQRYQTASEAAQALEPFTIPAGLPLPLLPTPRSGGERSSGSLMLPGGDPRLNQFLSALATQADDPGASRAGLPSPRLPRPAVNGKTSLAIASGIIAVALLLGIWRWAGAVQLVIDWPVKERRGAALRVNGRSIPLPGDDRVVVAGRSGPWDVQLTRPGYEPLRETLDMTFGERRDYVPDWRPTPRTIRQQELGQFKQRAAALTAADPLNGDAAALRSEMIRFRARHGATEEGASAAKLLATLPAPLDRLSRETIPPEWLRQSGFGDPAQAPAPLVGMVSDGAPLFWNRITSVSTSADGRWIAATGLDGTVRLFERDSPVERHVLRLSTEPREVLFSPAGDTFAVAGQGREVTLWRATDAAQLHTLRGASGPLAFSGDGETLAAHWRRQEFALFETATGRSLRVLSAAGLGQPRTAALSADGRALAAYVNNIAVILWDTSSDAPPRRLPATHWPRFSPEGSVLAVGDGDGNLLLRHPRSGEVLQTFRRGGTPLGFAQDGTTLVSYRRGTVMVWDLASGAERRTLVNVPPQAVVSPDARYLAGASDKGADLRVWNLEDGQVQTATGFSGAITALAFAPDSQRLVTGGADHAVRQWSLPRAEPVAELPLPWGPVCVSPDGQWAAISRAERVEVRNLLAGSETPGTLQGDPAVMTALAWSPHEAVIAGFGGSGFLGNSLRLWQWPGGRELSIDAPSAGAAKVLAFGPTGQRLATAGEAGSVLVWDVSRRTVAQTLSDLPAGVLSLAFDRSRRWLAAATKTGVAAWDEKAAQLLTLTLPPKAEVHQLQFSRDGRLAAATTAGILVWELPGEKPICTLACRPGSPACLAVSDRGDRLAAAGNSGTVWVWNWPDDGLPSGAPDETHAIGPAGGLVRQLDWSADGRHLLTVNGNSTLYVLRLRPAE